MRFNLLNQKIPTLLGIFIIAAGIATTSFLTKNAVIFTGRANLPETPNNIRVTNITDSSFNVSYITSSSVPGSLSYGKEKAEEKVAFDDRDQQPGILNSYKTHYLTVKNLEASTKYYFTILSGKTTFFATTEGQIPFSVTTGPPLEQLPPDQKPVVGKIILPNGSPAEGALVYLTLSQAQSLSAIVKPDGSYMIPLNSMRNQDLNAYFDFPKNSRMNLLVVDELLKSTATFSLSENNLIPSVTLSKNYDFVIGESPLASSSGEVSADNETISFPTIAANPSIIKEPEIKTPAEKESFVDSQPLFKGTAQPGEKVKIVIHSDNKIEIEVTADKNGNWNYRPSEKLLPGEHTISIVTKDAFGSLKTITRSFTVYAAGSQVSESATPSATPTISLKMSPTQTASATPTLISSPTPTVILSPTPTVILPQKIKEKPGNPLVERGLLIAGLILTISFCFIFLNRKSISL